jgi:hypothetical protein
MSLGMSSGLINQLDYESGYRFIVSDLSRTPSEASDNVSKSIQVIGTNSGKSNQLIFTGSWSSKDR